MIRCMERIHPSPLLPICPALAKTVQVRIRVPVAFLGHGPGENCTPLWPPPNKIGYKVAVLLTRT